MLIQSIWMHNHITATFDIYFTAVKKKTGNALFDLTIYELGYVKKRL